MIDIRCKNCNKVLAKAVVFIGAANLKTWCSVPKANIKTINGIPLANVKSINGLT